MIHDPLINKRFSELEMRAEEIASSKEFDFQSRETGKKYYKIPTPMFNG